VTDGVSNLGSGGMYTKMQAANMAQNAGCVTLICNGETECPVSSVLKNGRKHTKITAHTDQPSSWATWLTDRLQIAGSIVLSRDAADALRKAVVPILRGDIVSIQGPYLKADVIHIFDEDGEEIARGLSNFTAEETMVLARNPDTEPVQLLGYRTSGTIISKDNLIRLDDRHLPWDTPDEETLLEVDS